MVLLWSPNVHKEWPTFFQCESKVQNRPLEFIFQTLQQPPKLSENALLET